MEDHPQTLLTGPTDRVPVPGWMAPLSPTVANEREIQRSGPLPELTVVRAGTPEKVLDHSVFLRHLASRFRLTPEPSKIVFVFDRAKRAIEVTDMLEVLRFFTRSARRSADIEFARGADEAAFVLREASAKILALRDQASSPSSDPLGELRSVIDATADLRSTSGKLSAQKTAEALGLSVAELARLIGRSRQAVSKTPDADSLQSSLAPLERIARLRAWLSAKGFRAFLNLPNEQLDGRSPLDVIRDGQAGIVADLVEDMLTGSPT